MERDHLTCRVIDAHAHIYPEKIAQKAAAAIGAFYEAPMRYDGTARNLLASGERIGTERYLVCGVATVPDQVQSVNDFIAASAAREPRFVPLGTLHPAMADVEREIDRIEALGLRGIKLHADFQRFCIDDPAAMPIYRAAAARRLPILFHTGDSRYDFSHPDCLRRVLAEVPDLIAIAAHFGGYSEWDDVYHYERSPNLYFDTCSSLAWLSADRAAALIDHFGADRFLFGTDYPMWDHREELERLRSLGLSDSDLRGILALNFEDLFDRRLAR